MGSTFMVVVSIGWDFVERATSLCFVDKRRSLK